MSIDEKINELIKSGKLFHRAPEDPTAMQLRTVYVSREVYALLEGHEGVRRELRQVGAQAGVLLDAFTACKHITMGMDPYDKKSSALFARNADVKHGVCDLRVLSPEPQIRVFGAFARRDVFVALTYNKRHLLDFTSATNRSRKQWDYLFGEHKPVLSENVNDYISPPVTAV